MAEKLVYYVTVFLSLMAITLLIANIVLIEENHTLQNELAQRQAVINDGANLSQFDQGLVNTLASLATKNDDRDLRALLTTQGFVIKQNAEQQVGSDKISAPEDNRSKK